MDCLGSYPDPKSTCIASIASRRPTAVFIDMDALSHNFREVLQRVNGRKILAVVKAEAYGHGATEVSRRVLGLGADMLGVALVEEGYRLRERDIAAPILVMGALFPEQADAVVAAGLTPVVFTNPIAHALSQAAKKRGTTVSVHVKIDTGMGRIGISPENAPDFILELRKLANIKVEGLMTHFADVDLRDKQYASYQVGRFSELVRTLATRGIDIPFRHAANSAAILDYCQAFLTMVRPGTDVIRL